MIENKKLPIIIAGVVIGLIILVAVFNNKPEKKLSKAIDAIPLNAGLVFETKDMGGFTEILAANEMLINEALKSEGPGRMVSELNYVNKLQKENSNFRKFLNNREFIISVHQSQQYDAAKLFVSPVSKKSYEKLGNNLRKIYPDAEIKKITKEDAIILEFHLPQNPEYSFYISHYNDLFLMSFSEILMQRSLRTLKSTASLASNKDFIEMSKLTGKTGHRLFINYQYLPEIIYKYINPETGVENFLKNFASVTGLEIAVKNNEIQLDGYTSAKESNKYLNIFRKQKPGKTNIPSLLPQSASSFVIVNIGKGKEFKKKYEQHLSDFNHLKNYRRNLNEWYRNNQTGAKPDFFECIGGEIAIVSLAQDASRDNKQMILTEIADREKTLAFLKANVAKQDSSAGRFSIGERKFMYFPFSNNDFFKISFGELFGSARVNLACLYDDYIIFTETKSALKKFLQADSKNNNSNSRDYIASFNKESNLFLYFDLYKSFPVLKNYMSDFSTKEFETDKNFYRKLKGPGIQFLADSDPIYTTLKLKPGLQASSKLMSEWEFNLDSPPATKPFVVKNHNTGANEIFIQTQSNTVYLINNRGEILWEEIIDDKIISEVFQIDYYKNNKLQLLFNTRNKLHLIDRKGNNTADYPIEFKHKASNGISVFDYENNKDYRIFFAAENKSVNLLDKTGSRINGWIFDKTQNTVTQSVQHFVYEGRDYICFFDDNKLYITDRRGNIRVKPEADFPVARNTEIFFEPKTETSFPRFVLTDPAGSVYFVYLDGIVKRLKTKTHSADHYFMYHNITGNDYPEFIYADSKKLTVFDRNKKQLFRLDFPDEITHRLYTYRFSENEIDLGVITGEANKAYLVNSSGKIYPGFPVYGNTPFSIRKFRDNENFSLISGNQSTKLISYTLIK